MNCRNIYSAYRFHIDSNSVILVQSLRLTRVAFPPRFSTRLKLSNFEISFVLHVKRSNVNCAILKALIAISLMNAHRSVPCLRVRLSTSKVRRNKLEL